MPTCDTCGASLEHETPSHPRCYSERLETLQSTCSSGRNVLAAQAKLGGWDGESDVELFIG